MIAAMGESRLDVDSVERAYQGLRSRGIAAEDAITNRKTLLGGWFGNNDTLEQTRGALRSILFGSSATSCEYPCNPTVGSDNAALETFRRVGYEAVEDDSKVDKFLELGKTIESSIAAIDGYADGATLSNSVKLTAIKTAEDAGKLAVDAAKGIGSLIPWYGWIAGVVVLGGIVYLKVK